MFNFANVLRVPAHDPSTHVVLGTPIHAEPQPGQEVLYCAAGCFWGVEKIFWSAPGVVTTATGYMGGHTSNPTYPEVCTKTTGHAETVRIVFDTTKTSAAELIALFFENPRPHSRGPPRQRHWPSIPLCNLDNDPRTAHGRPSHPGCLPGRTG